MGITALRNAGDALQQEEEEAMAEMSSDPSFPKVLTAGRALARGEGYGGFLGHSLRPNADLGQTVAEEIGRGADFIKVIVSGAVDFSRSAVEGPYFSESQLKEVVAVASSFGVPVAAHANGPKSIGMRSHRNSKRRGNRHHFLELRFREVGAFHDLSLIHISEPTRRTPISYAVF